MSAPSLVVNDGDRVRRLRFEDGAEVVLELAEDGSAVSARTGDGAAIGELSFREEDDGGYFLKYAFFDACGGRYKRRGLGRAALCFHIQVFGCPVRAADHDGNRRDDGGHLTGDAPGFVAAMRAEGLIEPSESDDGSFDEGA